MRNHVAAYDDRDALRVPCSRDSLFIFNRRCRIHPFHLHLLRICTLHAKPSRLLDVPRHAQ